MITRERFQIQIDRLIDTFGEKAFSEQREHLIWEIVKDLEYHSLIAIVDGFISTARHAPLPADFKEAAKDFDRVTKRYALGEIQPREIAKCYDCGDSGFIRLSRKSTYESWAKWHIGSAPCHCPRGKELIEAGKRKKPKPIDFGPQYSLRWATSYNIMPAHDYAEPRFARDENPDPDGAA